LRSHAL